MGKKDKRNKNGAAPSSPIVRKTLFSKRGKRLMSFGAAGVVLGYIVLCFTDPRGQNFASVLSPFLLITGYVLIGVGIVTRDKPSEAIPN
jgi:hypothetical protein